MLKKSCASSYRILTTAIISLGILCAPLISYAAQDRTYWVIPQSLDELLDRATLIFIGEIGPVEQCLSISGYDWDGSVNGTPVDCANPQNWSGVPVTDFRLTVEEVLRDDGTIASGEPIILRALGFATKEGKEITKDSEFPLSYTGDRHLFLLGRNPDGTYGISYGVWSRLIIDGESLRVSSGWQQPLQFQDSNGPITLAAFRQAVANHKNERIYIPLIHSLAVRARIDTAEASSLLATIVTTGAMRGVSLNRSVDQGRSMIPCCQAQATALARESAPSLL